MATYPKQNVGHPMRVQARKGSVVERRYAKSVLPGLKLGYPAAIARGVSPAPLSDLIFHGGKTVAQIEYQNIYLGSQDDWKASDISAIETAIKRVTQHKGLNNVLQQYFPGGKVTCDPRQALVLDDDKPATLDESDVQAKVTALYDAGDISKKDLGSTIFNLVLPPGAVLRLDGSSSTDGLGGFHGSVHIKRAGKRITLYYSANVYSQLQTNGDENGIVAFKRPWKNVVATLYHEICEFRTDADVNDAIEKNDNDFLGWMSREGEECGDQPIAANAIARVFKEVLLSGKRTPLQLMYSNHVHGAEGPIAKAR